MADQVQCPRCGGQKIKSEKKEIAQTIKLTGKERSQSLYGGWLFIILGAALVLIAFETSNLYSFTGWLGLIFATLGLIILLIRSSQGIKKVVGVNFAYTCQDCGYQWKWKKGTPLPKVKANPELRK